MPGFADVVGNLPPLPELILWRDPVARSAAEAMAVDEALLEWGEFPVRRTKCNSSPGKILRAVPSSSK